MMDAMGELIRLENTIQNYAWGSLTALAKMRGEETPSTQPEAELWVGAHDAAPSYALIGEDRIALNQLIEQNPQHFLPSNYEGTTFPFLFKILAIDAPLSIQVHPTPEQALAGYHAENEQNIPVDAPHRNYKDEHSKPETVIALSDMTILTGVRPVEELQHIAQVFDLQWLLPLLTAPNDKEFLAAILRMDTADAKRHLEVTLSHTAQWLEQNPTVVEGVLYDVAQLMQLLQQKHPADIGALVAMVMNLLHLHPGDSAYTPDGQVHAYVSGTAIELMNPSDNVMRAGLTPKHIDVEELIRILAVQQDAPVVQRAQPDDDALGVFSMWDPRLSVTRVKLSQGQSVSYTFKGAAAVIGTSGELTISTPNVQLTLGATESLLHAGSDTPTTMSGVGEAYIAAYI
ncbi:mannose-6-phosphate isomerase, class I [Rothia sp. P6271]|uniref:mannose-6-phosphate isomerase, class I n=1 Tax=Rothia sp. P6271 TaxID=3402659 RepID=UPI003ABFD9DF